MMSCLRSARDEVISPEICNAYDHMSELDAYHFFIANLGDDSVRFGDYDCVNFTNIVDATNLQTQYSLNLAAGF